MHSQSCSRYYTEVVACIFFLFRYNRFVVKSNTTEYGDATQSSGEIFLKAFFRAFQVSTVV